MQLVNNTRRKCGVSGSDLLTVAGQSGESLRFINWVNDAWIDIQGTYENWEFMRTTFIFTTVNQRQSNTPAQANTTNFANWKRNSLRIYQTSLGFNNEIWIPFHDYESFRNLYQFGAMRSNYQRPVVYSIDPAKNLLLGPGPNAAGYTVIGEYYTAPVELSLDADTPSMPAEYHKMIEYRTMMFYAEYEAAQDVYQTGKTEFDKFLQRLELNQLPPVEFGDPLV